MPNLKTYELMAIFAPNRSKNDQEKSLEEIKKQITTLKGTIAYEDVWGLRTLAYRLKSFDEGFYVVIDFVMPSSQVKKLEEFLRLDRYVLRYLVEITPKSFQKLSYDQMQKDDQLLLIKKKEQKEKKLAPPPLMSPARVSPVKPLAVTPPVVEDAAVAKMVKEIAEESPPVILDKPAPDPIDKNFEQKLQDIIDGDI